MMERSGNSSRQITVFGGSGFIGRHLVRRLAAGGDRVRVAVRDPEAAMFLKPLGDVGQIVPVAADISDEKSVTAALRGADAVVNLVGILFETRFRARRRTFEEIHHLGAHRVAMMAAAAGVRRLVHVSSIGADKTSESAYARTKAAGEAAVRNAVAEATIIRPSVVFGPEDGFFNLFASLMRFTPILPVFGCGAPRVEFPAHGWPWLNIFGAGGTRFQPVYVGDVADAIVTCLRFAPSPLDSVREARGHEVGGKTFELGGPRTYSFKELMELLMAVTGRKRLLVPVPFWAASLEAAILELLPKPVLTRDQVKLLKRDNVVGKRALGFKQLGIEPTAAEIILPTYLARFRRPGALART